MMMLHPLVLQHRYPLENVSLPPNPKVPSGFSKRVWDSNGNFAMEFFTNIGPSFRNANQSDYGFSHPVDPIYTQVLRRGYFAATSFVDSQVGHVLDALGEHDYVKNTIVTLWSDHGWHLGDTNSWGKMTNFESATRSTLLWRVPGQSLASRGRNQRFVEMLDLWPTLTELAGLPALPACDGIDAPPTKACLQGESYAAEFAVTSSSPAGPAPKQHVFSQWPAPPSDNHNQTTTNVLQMGYTVRSADGYRYTEYVPYNPYTHLGDWTDAKGMLDPELYDYNHDNWETTNVAANPLYARQVQALKSVLRNQYVRATHWPP